MDTGTMIVACLPIRPYFTPRFCDTMAGCCVHSIGADDRAHADSLQFLYLDPFTICLDEVLSCSHDHRPGYSL